MAATITLTGTVLGGPTGPETFTVSIAVSGTLINDQNPLTLTTPTTNILPPTGATVMHFTPPPGNRTSILIGSYYCHRTLPTLLALDPGQSNIIFTPGATITGCELRWY